MVPFRLMDPSPAQVLSEIDVKAANTAVLLIITAIKEERQTQTQTQDDQLLQFLAILFLMHYIPFYSAALLSWHRCCIHSMTFP